MPLNPGQTMSMNPGKPLIVCQNTPVPDGEPRRNPPLGGVDPTLGKRLRSWNSLWASACPEARCFVWGACLNISDGGSWLNGRSPWEAHRAMVGVAREQWGRDLSG